MKLEKVTITGADNSTPIFDLVELSRRFPFGYAGGLGPENVVEQVAAIEKVCDQPHWIDMERRVRTDDDSALDLNKVRAVLEAGA